MERSDEYKAAENGAMKWLGWDGPCSAIPIARPRACAARQTAGAAREDADLALRPHHRVPQSPILQGQAWKLLEPSAHNVRLNIVIPSLQLV